MAIIIEKMTEKHIDDVVEIEKASFSMPWSRDAFTESMAYDYAIFLAAVDDAIEKTVGYIGLYKIFNEGDITNIAISPEYRGQGIGGMLMDSVINMAEKENIENLMLEVRQSNAVAINLYEKKGFIRAGIRKRFYEKPVEDAIVMIRKINPL